MMRSPSTNLPPNLIHAVIATEDRRFFDHYGIDFIGTLRALTVNTRANGVVQGGSSLTQQLAKNLFLSNERTMTRKVNEAFLAVWLESRLTKREILSLYLDRAYLGAGYVRGSGGFRVLFRQVGARPHPARGGDDRPACSKRRRNTPRTSICRPPVPVPTMS